MLLLLFCRKKRPIPRTSLFHHGDVVTWGYPLWNQRNSTIWRWWVREKRFILLSSQQYLLFSPFYHQYTSKIDQLHPTSHSLGYTHYSRRSLDYRDMCCGVKCVTINVLASPLQRIPQRLAGLQPLGLWGPNPHAVRLGQMRSLWR